MMQQHTQFIQHATGIYIYRFA